MASLGMLVAGIAHEINTPGGAIVSTGDTLGRFPGKLGEAPQAGSRIRRLAIWCLLNR